MTRALRPDSWACRICEWSRRGRRWSRGTDAYCLWCSSLPAVDMPRTPGAYVPIPRATARYVRPRK